MAGVNKIKQKNFLTFKQIPKVDFESKRLISIYQDMEAYNITLEDFTSKTSLGKTIPTVQKHVKIVTQIPSISEELLANNKGF